MANVRSAYSELVTAYLTDGGTQSAYVKATQTQNNWQSNNNSDKAYIGTDIKTSGVSGGASGGSAGKVEVPFATTKNTNKYYKVNIADNGTVTVTAVASGAS